jgi:hypothetical protein
MKNYKDLLAQKFLDLANLSIATLIFGEVISGKFRLITALIGIGLFTLLHFIAYQLKKE